MLQLVLAVLVGYFVIAAVVMAAFTLAYVVLGTEASFRPGSFEPSATWIGLSLVVGLIAALLGGLACARLDRQGKAPNVLSGLVLVLGLGLAAYHMATPAPAPAPRTGDIPVFEAARLARQPAWVEWVNPLVGAVGVWLGAAAVKRRREGGSA